MEYQFNRRHAAVECNFNGETLSMLFTVHLMSGLPDQSQNETRPSLRRDASKSIDPQV
jgi:hypothetical protein